jgi:hypothetical protein
MPAISARAPIYATECKRRAPRLTVLPQGTRHPLLQHVARTGVRLRAPTRRKPVNNARVWQGQEGRRHSAIASVARIIAPAMLSRGVAVWPLPWPLAACRLAGSLGRPPLLRGSVRRAGPPRLTLSSPWRLARRPLSATTPQAQLSCGVGSQVECVSFMPLSQLAAGCGWATPGLHRYAQRTERLPTF